MQRWFYALFVVMIGIGVVAGLALTGLPPFAHPTSSPALRLLTFDEAMEAARTPAPAYPAPAWELVAARGFVSPVPYSIPMVTLWSDEGGNLTCSPPSFAQGSNFTIAGFPPDWSAGVAPTWLFEFQNFAASSAVVVAVTDGVAEPLWPVDEGNPGCHLVSSSATSTVPDVDSPSAVATSWVDGGEAFENTHTTDSQEITVINGTYSIAYAACAFGGPGTVAELTVNVSGSSGSFASATNHTLSCQASSGLPEGGSTLPPSSMTQRLGVGATRAPRACAPDENT